MTLNTHERVDDVAGVAIIGAGFSGLGMAIALVKSGRRDFVILEKAAGIGGTWRDNTYPGCACDVPSHLYSFSHDLNPGWSRMYPQQAEILAYQNTVADRYALRPHIRTGAKVTELRWDEENALWTLTTEDRRTFRARAVVSGMGGLHIPAWPDLPGMADFEGPSFHTSHWDHATDLADKRIAVIGTGASAIQVVPAIAPKVAKLTLFQRTPPWVVPKGDRPMSTLERSLFRHIPFVQQVYRWVIYAMNEVRAIGFTRQPERMVRGEDDGRAHIARQIQDPQLRAKVTPNYRIGCKRVLISNDYYPALTRDNVTLETDPIVAITPEGVRLHDGREIAVDVIIYATGFKPFDMMESTTIIGRNGRNLGAEWGQSPQAHKGITVSGYPNLFFLMGPHTGLGHNSIIYMIESGIRYVMDALETLDRRGAAALDVRPEAQSAFVADVRERLKGTVWATGCRSWYMNADGEVPTLWPDFTFRYRRLTARLDAANYEFITARMAGPGAERRM